MFATSHNNFDSSLTNNNSGTPITNPVTKHNDEQGHNLTVMAQMMQLHCLGLRYVVIFLIRV